MEGKTKAQCFKRCATLASACSPASAYHARPCPHVSRCCCSSAFHMYQCRTAANRICVGLQPRFKVLSLLAGQFQGAAANISSKGAELRGAIVWWFWTEWVAGSSDQIQ